VEELLAAGEDVVILDNMHTGNPSNLEDLKGSLELIKASCNDLPEMDLHPEKIYHLGIPSSSPMYKKNPYLVGEALNGFTAVFELAKKSGARVVYASSSSLYNGLMPPHREDMTIQVRGLLHRGPACHGEDGRALQEALRCLLGGNEVLLRYGPKETAKKQYANMVTQFLWEMRVGKTPLIFVMEHKPGISLMSKMWCER